MEVKKKKRCQDCSHCTWLNRWRCDLTCWQFDIFLPVDCGEFKKKPKKKSV